MIGKPIDKKCASVMIIWSVRFVYTSLQSDLHEKGFDEWW